MHAQAPKWLESVRVSGMTRCLVAFMLALCCLDASSQDVGAGQLFSGRLLNIRAPNSDGWKFGASSNAGMGFARRGAAPDEIYGAQVILFALPESTDRDEFVSLIKQDVERDTPPERFTTIEANFEYMGQRGYPCVRYKGLFDDKQAATSLFG